MEKQKRIPADTRGMLLRAGPWSNPKALAWTPWQDFSSFQKQLNSIKRKSQGYNNWGRNVEKWDKQKPEFLLLLMGELTLPTLLLCLCLSLSPSLHHTAYPQTWEIMSRFKYLIGEQQAGVPTVRHSSGTDRAELARRKLERWGSANS